MAYSHTVDWNGVVDYSFAMKSGITYSMECRTTDTTRIQCKSTSCTEYGSRATLILLQFQQKKIMEPSNWIVDERSGNIFHLNPFGGVSCSILTLFVSMRRPRIPNVMKMWASSFWRGCVSTLHALEVRDCDTHDEILLRCANGITKWVSEFQNGKFSGWNLVVDVKKSICGPYHTTCEIDYSRKSGKGRTLLRILSVFVQHLHRDGWNYYSGLQPAPFWKG